jgi:hypothetical protein
LFAAHSSIPFVGIALAVAGIATMIATITRLKATARNSATQFKTGTQSNSWLSDNGLIHGRSHADGGNLLEVEKGELLQVGQDGGRKRVAIVRKERVSEYFDLLDAANRGDRAALAKHAFDLSGANIEVDRATIARRVFNSTSAPSPTPGKDTGRMEQILEKMLAVMMRGETNEHYSSDGRVRRRGSTTTYFK